MATPSGAPTLFPCATIPLVGLVVPPCTPAIVVMSGDRLMVYAAEPTALVKLLPVAYIATSDTPVS